MSSALDDLLSPLPRSEFFTRYYEKAPVHISKDGNVPLLNAVELDSLIRTIAETNPDRLRANYRGRVLAPPRNAAPAELYDWARAAHENGATLVLNYMEALDSRCRSFAAALGTSLQARVTFTVFMTPTNTQGFTPHFDTLDVFVVQLSGSKRWHLGNAALRLPTLRQGYLVDHQAAEARTQSQVTLLPGHVLYIPRGVVHWATTTDEPSVHITADIATATMGDVLSAAIRHPELLDEPEAIRAAESRPLIQEPKPLGPHLQPLLSVMGAQAGATELHAKARRDKWNRKR